MDPSLRALSRFTAHLTNSAPTSRQFRIPSTFSCILENTMILCCFQKKKQFNEQKGMNELGRMIASILLFISIFWVIGSINGGSGSLLQAFVKYVVLLADHHPHVRCVDLVSEEWYLLIDDNLLSVASIKPDISFSQRACNPE